jgi:hypothetical protein
MHHRFIVLMLMVSLLPIGSAQVSGDVVFSPQTVDLQFSAWEQQYPGFVERFELGVSLMGTPLYGIRITNESAHTELTTGAKRDVYLDGGHHGNEYLGVQLAMYYVEDVLARLDEPGIQQLLADHVLHVVPIINPDGNLRDTRYNGRLVDLNRNYDFGWNPCANACILNGGDAPHSEPEIQANVAFVTSISPDLWVSTHTGIETLFWPQGNANTPGDPFVPFAPDIGVFETMEVGFEASTNGRIDAYGGPAAAVGSAEDYGYGVHGIPTFVYEVHNDQFFPAYDVPMRDMLVEQLAGMHFLVDSAWKMGAWVELEQVGEDVIATNYGWGPTNVTMASAAGTQSLWLGPGNSTVVDVAGTTSWTYPAMLIETSRIRAHGAEFAPSAEGTDGALGVPLPGVLALLGIGAALRIRRIR